MVAWAGTYSRRVTDAAPPPPQRLPRDALYWLHATMVLAVVVPALLFVAAAVALREQALAQARGQVDGAVAIAAEHASKVFDVNASLLARLADALGEDDDDALLAREEALHQQMKRMGADLPQLQGLFVLSSKGRMIATNRAYPAPHAIDFSDRLFFRHHRDGGPQPFLSEVLTSRTTGEAFFDMSVRRERAGAFGGALSSSLLPQYFADLYSQLPGADAGLHVALLRRDGTPLAGWPESPTSRDRAPRAGVDNAVPSAPGSAPARAGDVAPGPSLLVAARSLDRVPVRVVAWMDRADALAPWHRALALLVALTFPTSIALVYVAFLARQRTLQSAEMARRLDAEAQARSRTEEALRQAQKLEAMGRLTGGVAHDFNNLLTIVSNNLYLLRHLGPPRADDEKLAAIERAVKAGTQLTRQLLSFSRRQPLRPEVIALPERLPSIIGLLGPALGGTITVTTAIDARVAPIEVDAAELELALVNLALNARDAMPDGGSIRIEARDARPGEVVGITGPAVVVAMTDSGVGIEAALQERVFEPFFTTKPVGQGTGLGLTQVYGFCRRAGGVATVESQPGSGTTVRLGFPAAAASAVAPVPGRAKAIAGSFDGFRVLLVEDNPEVAAATQAVLVSMGCAVSDEKPEAALALLATQEFDLVLTDVVMPGMDGIELATRIRAAFPRLPVVLISGYSQSLERAVGLGLQVLPKPCSPDALAAAMAAARASRTEDRRPWTASTPS